MKLAAVYNVWGDSLEILPCSIKSIIDYVDLIIVVYSDYSNFGEFKKFELPDWCSFESDKIKRYKYDHVNGFSTMSGMESERSKRNLGLAMARHAGCTHIITMDSDEFYRPEDIGYAKMLMHRDVSLNGIVVKSQVYFKRPDLTVGEDVTLVPFIHRITPTLKYEMNRRYPYAWVDGQIRIDPTRQFNINSGVAFEKYIIMHHYSYVRKDLEIKIRNSSARENLEVSTIREDWANAEEGYFCKFYNRTLTKCENLFNLPLSF